MYYFQCSISLEEVGELQQVYDDERTNGVNLIKNNERVLRIKEEITSLKEYELN